MTAEGALPAMAETTMITFAEFEFLLRSAAGADGARTASMDAVRQKLSLQPEVAADIVTAAGVASLLARGLCTEQDGDVLPGELAVGAVAALSTLHTTTEAAGWIDTRPVVVHLFSGTAARLAVYPGSFGLFGVEVMNPAESLAQPLIRFVALCTAGTGETAVMVRSTSGDAAEVGLAVARNADGVWLLSDTLDQPDQSHPSSRAAVVARLEELFGTPVGV